MGRLQTSQLLPADRGRGRGNLLLAAAAFLLPGAQWLASPVFAEVGPAVSGIRMMPAQTAWQPLPGPVPAVNGTVDVGGARLWYTDTGGDGEAVVFVHPASGSALTWGYQQPVLARAGYRVVTYSRRGHFRSDAGSQDEPGTAAGDLLRLVEHLDLDRIHLVGIAAGADVLPDFAIAWPDRVRSLVIGSTIGKPGDPAYRASDETLLPAEFLALPAYLKELSPDYRAANPAGVDRWRELEAISATDRVPLRAMSVVTPAAIGGIDVPVLLLTGDSDLYMPPSRLRAYARYWRAPELAVLLEAGHAPYWEQPEAFNSLLLDFLGRHSEAMTSVPVSSGPADPAPAPGGQGFGDRQIRIERLAAQTEWQPVPPQAPVTEGHVDVDGARLWYRDTGGDGVPVILLHPYTGSALIWGYQQPALVAAGYRVIAYSRRGHYGSDAPADSVPKAAADDLRTLVGQLELEAFHLVGSAAGGFIVPDYAMSYPDGILSLTIATSTGGVQDAGYRSVFEDRVRRPEIVALPHWLKELGPSYRAANPEGTRAWIEMAHRSVQAIVRPPAKNALAWQDFEALDLPVLLIGADADIYMPPAMLRELAAHLRRPEVVMLSESGHSGYWEQPEAFNKALIRFLQRHDAGRRGQADPGTWR